jgi:Domain of unknown function (DUF4203)
VDITFGWVTYGILIGLIGIVFLFFGLRYYKAILFFLASAMSFYFLQNGIQWCCIKVGATAAFQEEYAFYLKWLIPGVLSMMVGFLTVQFWKIGIYIVGAVGGYFLGVFLLSLLMPIPEFHSFMTQIPININDATSALNGSSLEFWLKIAWFSGFILLGLVLVKFCERAIIIFTTCLVGAGCLCAAADAFANTHFHKFLSEIVKMSKSEYTNPEKFIKQFQNEPAYFGNLIALAILFCSGLLVQLRMAGLLKSMRIRRGDSFDARKSLV